MVSSGLMSQYDHADDEYQVYGDVHELQAHEREDGYDHQTWIQQENQRDEHGHGVRHHDDDGGYGRVADGNGSAHGVQIPKAKSLSP